MARPEEYTAAQVIEALEKSAGIKTQAAARLRCHVNTVHAYCKRYPTVAAAAKAQDDTLVDMAESVLVRRLQQSEWDAAKFVLTTKGKDRGWGQSTEVTGKDGGPIIFTIALDRPGDDRDDE